MNRLQYVNKSVEIIVKLSKRYADFSEVEKMVFD